MNNTLSKQISHQFRITSEPLRALFTKLADYSRDTRLERIQIDVKLVDGLLKLVRRQRNYIPHAQIHQNFGIFENRV